MSQGWKLKTVEVLITSTTSNTRLTDIVNPPAGYDRTAPIMTPSVVIHADESNTNDIGVSDSSTRLIADAGLVLAPRSSLSLEGPQMRGITEEVDLSQIWLCTDTANSIARVTYYVRT